MITQLITLSIVFVSFLPWTSIQIIFYLVLINLASSAYFVLQWHFLVSTLSNSDNIIVP
jgi:hypothetical protein